MFRPAEQSLFPGYIAYNEEKLKLDPALHTNGVYRQCTACVMDSIADPGIRFDENGVCGYHAMYEEDAAAHILHGEAGRQMLEETFAAIRQSGAGRDYDCILGVSGGVDSTYLALLAKEHGLRPLLVHFDNSWNSETAIRNIECMVDRLGFDLYTYLMDWQEFAALQRAYLRASVVNIDVITDHAFLSVLYKLARKWKIRYVLAGTNLATEQLLPGAWAFDAGDPDNIRDIFSRYGDRPLSALRNYPFMNYYERMYLIRFQKLKFVAPLNWIDYNYMAVKQRIAAELDWEDYPCKHYESVWTRIYQGYILPVKFHIDKRKAHLSNLIYSGQMTREEALEQLRKPIYDPGLLAGDIRYLCRKLDLSFSEFEDLMREPRREHNIFAVQRTFIQRYPLIGNLLKRLVLKTRS